MSNKCCLSTDRLTVHTHIHKHKADEIKRQSPRGHEADRPLHTAGRTSSQTTYSTKQEL